MVVSHFDIRVICLICLGEYDRFLKQSFFEVQYRIRVTLQARCCKASLH